MIERNDRYITLRKYGTAFLEAFGMLPLTYFGAVGDNMTDNYANIQVAINESIKRELKYIFVPEGKYYYTGTLLDDDKIMFIGNSDYAKIYNDETEIKIYQIGMQVPYVVGDTILSENVENTGYIDIGVPVKNAVETILVLQKNVLYVTNGLILLNGALMGDTKVYLTEEGENSAYITEIEILPNAIRINYDITGTGGLINKHVEWRVR
jgi:hypothetical protein